MKYELDGKTYYTETKTIRFVRLHEKRNGQVLTCCFNSLPLFPSEQEVNDFMLSKGAKVVGE